ncbi:hypothetical protein PV350_24775 [Streptomyces sp. PA03-6a]|nr:hypothetical protein [Streptomyces sp. PA03-6a]
MTSELDAVFTRAEHGGVAVIVFDSADPASSSPTTTSPARTSWTRR